ncbi:hypothetical protein GGF37_004518 [Kickxella alabastrina]|nr:hypothetical protein GGF37_004518 [Kickxella alabastrina]
MDSNSDNDSGSDRDSADENESTEHKLSRKQKKRIRMSVAELKKKAARPEVVDWTDTSAPDPELLVAIKAARNTVPVPLHWGQKKKYLQYKRGMEKPPFELPEFIKATGIMEMREAVREKEDENKAKTTGREKMRPKMNKLTLDYQRLHDAFFRFQTPPKNMTSHGDLFYEGKESDTTFSFTPGVLSDSLKTALSIPPLAPPPWLINMQRYGPPPSYSNMIIPGLNAPIPPGAQWGFHPGGWGRPPVDEFGRPLYGDVFAAASAQSDVPVAAATNIVAGVPQPISDLSTGAKKYWGDLEVAESSDEEDDDEDEDSDENANSGAEEEANQPRGEAEAVGLTDEQLRSGMATIPSGLETPSVLQLRKQAAREDSTANKQLYTILPEQATAQLEGIMGSQFTYDMSTALDPSKKKGVGEPASKKSKVMGKGVDIAIDAAELEGLDQEALQAKYAEASASVGGHSGAGSVAQEDFSDMVAEHAATQSRKRKPTPATPGAESATQRKKAKDFKF